MTTENIDEHLISTDFQPTHLNLYQSVHDGVALMYFNDKQYSCIVKKECHLNTYQRSEYNNLTLRVGGS